MVSNVLGDVAGYVIGHDAELGYFRISELAVFGEYGGYRWSGTCILSPAGSRR